MLNEWQRKSVILYFQYEGTHLQTERRFSKKELKCDKKFWVELIDSVKGPSTTTIGVVVRGESSSLVLVKETRGTT